MVRRLSSSSRQGARGADPPGTALVTLRLELGAETISGTFKDQHGGERPFWGWLELSAALDQARGVDPGRRPSIEGLEEGA
jgi:hypothetical protein